MCNGDDRNKKDFDFNAMLMLLFQCRNCSSVCARDVDGAFVPAKTMSFSP